MSVIGAISHALGARIRMKYANVGAMKSMVTGVCMMAGLTEYPINIKGMGI